MRLCSKPDCGNLAWLTCPQCLSLKLTRDNVFCSQACFKSVWKLHKLLHNIARVDKDPQLIVSDNSKIICNSTGMLCNICYSKCTCKKCSKKHTRTECEGLLQMRRILLKELFKNEYEQQQKRSNKRKIENTVWIPGDIFLQLRYEQVTNATLL